MAQRRHEPKTVSLEPGPRRLRKGCRGPLDISPGGHAGAIRGRCDTATSRTLRGNPALLVSSDAL